MRQTIAKTENYRQPGERYRSFDAARQARFRGRFLQWLTSAGVTPALQGKWVELWGLADKGLGAALKSELAAATAKTKKPAAAVAATVAERG